MQFSLPKSIEILERTPVVLSSMLNDINSEWIDSNEGENTWTPKEVVAHLIICEKTNWLPRAKIILSDTTNKVFNPIDMVAHFDLAKRYSAQNLIEEFTQLRENSIKELINLNLGENSWKESATHPKVGIVNLQQLIATWVTHDLSHIVQISRVMAKQNKENVGPFATYLKILKS